MNNLTKRTTGRAVDPFEGLVANFFGRHIVAGADLRDHAGTWMPTAAVVVDGDSYVFHFDVPGVAREDLDISVEDGTITVSGERKSRLADDDKANVYRRESFYGAFRRSFKLPGDADPTEISAAYKDGVLEVRVPKAEEVKARKIEIAAN